MALAGIHLLIVYELVDIFLLLLLLLFFSRRTRARIRRSRIVSCLFLRSSTGLQLNFFQLSRDSEKANKMIPVTLSDGRSIFFKNEKLLSALCYLPNGVVLPKLSKYVYEVDPEQYDVAEEQSHHTPYEYVRSTIEKLNDLLESRPPKNVTKGKELNQEEELKFFFEDLHYKLAEKKRFFLRGLLFKLPDVYSPHYIKRDYNTYIVEKIEKV